MSEQLQEIPLTTITGDESSLGDYAGKVLLVVNVASKCGLTPQYEGLVALNRKYGDRGFVVLGFPANDFGKQEPGTEEEIAAFCTTKFGVDFPMFSKIVTTGPNKHPLYQALTTAYPKASGDADAMRQGQRSRGRTPTEEPELLWNFEKFLISRDGRVVGRFVPRTKPNAPELEAAIEAELKKEG
jgi:glutathione peroxidase